jgi:hypothetical protein
LTGCGQNPSTSAAIRPPCAAVAEHPNQHSAEISHDRVMRPWVDTGAHTAPSKKPQPRSGLLRQVPPSRKAAIHACHVSRPRAKRAEGGRKGTLFGSIGSYPSKQ